jgi:hypothetical protein
LKPRSRPAGSSRPAWRAPGAAAGPGRRGGDAAAAGPGRGRDGPAENPPGARRAWLAPALASAAAALALYLPALSYEFVRDDRELLLDGSGLRTPLFPARLLASDFWAATGGQSGLWRPWVELTLWLDGRLSGWSPAWFHAGNLLAHALATFLLVRAVTAYGGGLFAAWFAGLWFAAMPAHVEPVAWVAGRTDPWCALLVLAALVLERQGTAARRAAPVAFALALLSKESAAMAAPALALQRVVAPVGETRAGAWRAAAPYVLVLAGWAALHALLVHHLAPSPGLESFGRSRLWTALALPVWELRPLVPAVAHGPDWRLAALASPAPAAFVGLALHALAALGLARLVVRRDPLALPLAVLWFPLAGMSALALASGGLFSGERHVYLASAGAAWAAAAWLERSARAGFARIAAWTLVSLVVIASVRETLAFLPAWRNEETMYAAMVRTQPGNATGPLGQALARMERGDDAGAWGALARAAAIDSTRYEIALYRAGIVLRRGSAAEALGLARAAEARVGWNRDARLIQALALQRLGRWPLARPLLEDLVARSPGDPDVRRAWQAQRAAEARAPDSVRRGPRRSRDAPTSPE